MSSPKNVNKSTYTVIETEQDAGPLPSTPPGEKKRTFSDKLSVYNVWVLALGTIAVAAALTVLFYVWACANTAIKTGQAPHFWRLIVKLEWISRTITLCSVVIRFATGLQLGIFAAVLAALILERVGVLTEDLPHLSMIRCTNPGPHSLVWNVFNSLRVPSQFGYSALVVLAILNAFALQFTSTILLADVGLHTVKQEPQSNPQLYGLATTNRKGDTSTKHGYDFWTTGPSVYQRFAEYSEAGPQGTGFVDTGRTYRSYVPFQRPQDRETLRNFTGPATVADMRTICIRPKISNFTFEVGTDTTPVVRGTLQWENLHPALRQKDSISMEVTCGLPMQVSQFAKDATTNYWPLGLCKMLSGFGEISEGLRTDWEPNAAQNTSVYLLLNATGSDTEWDNAMADGNGTLQRSQSGNGPWSTYSWKNVRIDTSLCFLNPTPHDYHVNMWSTADVRDSVLGWDDVKGAYVTDAIRSQLGVTKNAHSMEARGVYHLERPSNWAVEQVETKDKVYTESFIWETVKDLTANVANGLDNTWLLSPYTTFPSVHRGHIVIAQDTLKDTSNPALAVQGLFTVLTQMAYYEFRPQFDASAPAIISNSENVLIPGRWGALITVSALLALHFVLLVTAIVLFLTKTKASLLGNGWQAVLQVVSDDTAQAVPKGHDMTDDEMRKIMKGEGRLRIARSATSGRLEAMDLRRRRHHSYQIPLDSI